VNFVIDSPPAGTVKSAFEKTNWIETAVVSTEVIVPLAIATLKF
jgi:hypothetical protein